MEIGPARNTADLLELETQLPVEEDLLEREEGRMSLYRQADGEKERAFPVRGVRN